MKKPIRETPLAGMLPEFQMGIFNLYEEKILATEISPSDIVEIDTGEINKILNNSLIEDKAAAIANPDILKFKGDREKDND